MGLHGHGARGQPSVNPALVPHGASVNITTRPIRVYDRYPDAAPLNEVVGINPHHFEKVVGTCRLPTTFEKVVGMYRVQWWVQGNFRFAAPPPFLDSDNF